MTKFARKCDATGKGMNEGFCVLDGHKYFSEEKYLIEFLNRLTEEFFQNSIKFQEIINENELNVDKGTSIKVKNIFFNVPARRNFLKSDFVELRHIMHVFHNIAISHHGIEFSFINNDEEIFYLKKESLKKRIKIKT